MIQGENRRPIRRRIQAHMDQRAHLQYQTDVPEAQERAAMTREHVAAHQSNRRSMGPTGQSADDPGQPIGPRRHSLTPLARSFPAAS